MPEQHFRYIAADRLKAWEAVGWQAISPVLAFQHLPAHLERFKDKGVVAVYIIEFVGDGAPIEPEEAIDCLVKQPC